MRPIHSIHQFHAGSAYGDAVTNSMFFIRKILRDMGFISDIYVQHIAPELTHELLNYAEYKPNNKHILLIHHSMGHDIFDWITSLPDEKYLIYHNITPHDFFPMGSPNNYYSQLGRRQLELFKDFVKGSICVSKYNQQELLDLGFQNTRVIPLLLNIDEILRKKWNQEIEIRNSYQFNILFVGRIAPNKCQHDIIEIGSYLKSVLTIPFKIHLIGGYDPGDPYYQDLCTRIKNKNLSDFVNIPGKVSDEDLYGYYRAADLFLCMSEHEGFGVPLIEAMVFNIPIIAYNSSNIPYTLGNSGILVNKKDPLVIATLIEYLLKNRYILRRITRVQREHLKSFSIHALMNKILDFFSEHDVLVPLNPVTVLKNPPLECNRYRIEGPFDSSYSLAIVNREIALALHTIHPHKVSLYSTDGLGDYSPSCNQISPDVQKMWREACSNPYADVVIRNLYPPRVSNMIGDKKILGSFGWEESGFPSEYINGFNAHLDGIATVSNYVTQLLINNGVSLPIQTMGNGVDHCLTIEEKKYRRSLGKGFRFLHISSCFPRKGVDILLKAYSMAFTIQDDVTLIIKTFPNPHNTVEEQIKDIKKNNNNCPDIFLINEDLDYGYIINLYKRCHALVAPSRGEGFGLPMAEAMLFYLPVITTGYGGQSDFCTDDTAWLIDYSFAYAKTHMNLPNSVWVEPSVDHLAKTMRDFFSGHVIKRKEKLQLAKVNILDNYSWFKCAERLDNFVSEINWDKNPKKERIRLGWVTSWGTKCGIASYSNFLLQYFDRAFFDVTIFSNSPMEEQDDHVDEIITCWNDASDSSLERLLSEVDKNKIDCLVIQFNFGFFNIKALGELIETLKEHRIVIIIMMHSTADVEKSDFHASLSWIRNSLKKVEKIFVHGVKDLNQLKDFGIISNVSIFPHGLCENVSLNCEQLKQEMNLVKKRIIGSYGFLLPHKGIIELIYAFKEFKNKYSDSHLFLVNAVYPINESLSLVGQCKSLIQSLNLVPDITMITDYLEDEVSLSLLSLSDVIVYPYQLTQESSSAAIRHGIVTGKPVVCTPLSIFDDVKPIVHFLPGISPQDIFLGLDALFRDERILLSRHDIQKEWIKNHNWKVISQRLQNIIMALVENKNKSDMVRTN